MIYIKNIKILKFNKNIIFFYSKKIKKINNLLKNFIYFNTIQNIEKKINIINKINLWIQCEDCYKLNYKKILYINNNICEYCGYYFNMNNQHRINLLIDKNTWNSLNEYLITKLNFEQEKIENSQNITGLTESIHTGIGKINGINVAIGIMDFIFIGGSMGAVVGEKIISLIKYTNLKKIPLIIISSSGGARMQEGSIGLMQMTKISSILFKFQMESKLLYIPILASPTTGGVTASFGMLGNIIIAEPNSTIAFAGKRVIEQTLNEIIPENSQTSEYLFEKGLFDIIIPRNLLKNILCNLFILHNII